MWIQIGIEGSFDGPIVRKMQLPPPGIVERGCLRAGSFAPEEPPIRVEIDAARAGNGNGGSGDKALHRQQRHEDGISRGHGVQLNYIRAQGVKRVLKASYRRGEAEDPRLRRVDRPEAYRTTRVLQDLRQNAFVTRAQQCP